MDNDVEADKKDEQVASLTNDEAHKKKNVKRDECMKKMEHERAGCDKGNL